MPERTPPKFGNGIVYLAGMDGLRHEGIDGFAFTLEDDTGKRFVLEIGAKDKEGVEPNPFDPFDNSASNLYFRLRISDREREDE